MIKLNQKQNKIIELLEELDPKKQLEIATEILDNVSNCFYIDGFIKESNTLTTCLLNIREILKEKEEEKREIPLF